MAATSAPEGSASVDGAARGSEAPPEVAGGAAAGGALDVLLTDAAVGPVRRWFPGRAGLNVAARLATRPDRVVRRGAGLAAELAKVAIGRSEVAPPKGDRRFKDPAWEGNPTFRRLAQAYLAAGGTVDRLLGDAGVDWRSERRVRFAAENVLDALAPSNFPLTNPAVFKAVLDTGGRNFVKGGRQFLGDMAKPPRIPSMVDKNAFQVGRDLAVTPGQVVLRTPVFELLQYEPTTTRVRERQVFTISWRNPDERHADWGLDTYAQAVLDALDAVEEISGADAVQALGLCAGGIVLSTVAAHLAATGRQDRLAGLTLGVCVLDNARAGTTGALTDPAVAAAAVADSARRGYLDGRALAGVFAWLRPNDLIWNYWINNYLLGKDP